MNVIRHENVGRDLKNLRRFPAPLESLESWERFFSVKGLEETPAVDRFPGFGQAKIYKARIVPLQENIGKSGGYRAVFQMIDAQCCKILVFSRHGVYKTEGELIGWVKERLV